MATRNIRGNGRLQRTETVSKDETLTIHAEKDQDIEVENDETHWVGHDRGIVARTSGFDDDGPSTLLQLQSQMQHENRFAGVADGSAVWDDTDIAHLNGEPSGEQEPFQFHKLTGDWNGAGSDTLGFGDADGDVDVDGADFAL